METNITKQHFKHGAVKYFRGKAENVQIGAYGEKKNLIGSAPYIDIQSKVKSEHLADRVKYVTTVDIDWQRTSKAELQVNGALKFFGASGKAAVSGSYQDGKSARLKLVKFAINAGPLKTMLNKDANGARKYLADEGKDGRIVSEVWVLMEGQLADHFASSGSVSVAAQKSGGHLDITASGGKMGSQTITYAPGTTFAYLLHKVKKWSKGKEKVEDMEADYKGMQ